MFETLTAAPTFSGKRFADVETPREKLVKAHEKYTGQSLSGFEAFLFYGLLNARQIQEKLSEFEALSETKARNVVNKKNK